MLPSFFDRVAASTQADPPRFREDPVTCPNCGGEAVNRVQVGGRRAFISLPPTGLRCATCDARREARDRAISEARWPGDLPRSPLGERARELVREIERLAADAADPALAGEGRQTASQQLETLTPTDLGRAAASRRQQDEALHLGRETATARRRHAAAKRVQACADEIARYRDRDPPWGAKAIYEALRERHGADSPSREAVRMAVQRLEAKKKAARLRP
jgi:hypothetical protein